MDIGQKTNDDQDKNNDGQTIGETSFIRHARNDSLTEETEQPMHGQDDDDQLNQRSIFSPLIHGQGNFAMGSVCGW